MPIENTGPGGVRSRAGTVTNDAASTLRDQVYTTEDSNGVVTGIVALDGKVIAATTAATVNATASLVVGSGTPITKIVVYSAAIDPASVATITSAEQTFTVAGLTTADKVVVVKPSLTAGLGIVNARVSAANTLAITFMNTTAAAIDAPLETYTIVALRS